MKKQVSLLALLGCAATLASCKVGPDYVRPSAPQAAGFKEAVVLPPKAGWKQADPRDASNKGHWWEVYNDPVLNDLEHQVETSNQTLKQQEAAFRQARAIVEEARSNLFPTVSVGGSASRSRSGSGGSSSRFRSSSTSATSTSTGVSTTGISTAGIGTSSLGNAGLATSGGSGSTGTTIISSSSSGPINDYGLTSSVNWDVDLWGKIRRTVESDVASAQASAADVANARLSAQGTLATDYFTLRIADENQRLLNDTVNAYKTSYDITMRQYNVGIVARSDVIQAQTQLQAAQAQLVDIGQTRAQFEHAIATLVGKPPSSVTIAPAKLVADVPNIPTGLSSALLERRPDIAGAERRMASANAEIGVAIAAYYPDFTISASGDFTSTMIDTLAHASSFAWSVGGNLSETIFDAGLRSAQIEAARAIYDQNLALYRATVLTGFQQVEDELSALRVYGQELQIRLSDQQSADLAVRLLLNQYRAGTVAYTSVVTAQATALSAAEAALTVRQNRLNASVTLVQALGGGWTQQELPDGDALYGTTTGLKETASTK